MAAEHECDTWSNGGRYSSARLAAEKPRGGVDQARGVARKPRSSQLLALARSSERSLELREVDEPCES